MTERLTVVFDDPRLYRDLKVFAAERGIAMKQVIEQALTRYMRESDNADQEGDMDTIETPERARMLDWDSWDSYQAELDAIEEPPGTVYASDVKRELYGSRELTERGWRYAAEEPAPYDAR